MECCCVMAFSVQRYSDLWYLPQYRYTPLYRSLLYAAEGYFVNITDKEICAIGTGRFRTAVIAVPVYCRVGCFIHSPAPTVKYPEVYMIY